MQAIQTGSSTHPVAQLGRSGKSTALPIRLHPLPQSSLFTLHLGAATAPVAEAGPDFLAPLAPMTAQLPEVSPILAQPEQQNASKDEQLHKLEEEEKNIKEELDIAILRVSQKFPHPPAKMG